MAVWAWKKEDLSLSPLSMPLPLTSLPSPLPFHLPAFLDSLFFLFSHPYCSPLWSSLRFSIPPPFHAGSSFSSSSLSPLPFLPLILRGGFISLPFPSLLPFGEGERHGYQAASPLSNMQILTSTKVKHMHT